MRLTISLLFSFLLMSCAVAGGSNKLPTAEFVDVERYVGKWYAVKALPQRFTRDCKAQTAEYGVINDRQISVLNTCIKENGTSTIQGTATVKNTRTNAELGVKFNTWWNRLLFFIKGDYTVIKLDPNYEFVMVGSNDRKSLWYLSRRPGMPEDVIEEYDALAREIGFKVDQMVVSEF